MKHPQVLNIRTASAYDDNQISIDSLDVVRDSDQTMMHTIPIYSIQVDISIWDLMTGATAGTKTNKTMTYESGPDIWTIDVSDFSDILTDKHKYVAKISENGGSVMRTFKLQEFAVDNDSMEDAWMTLPYEIVLTPTPKIIWYSDSIGGTPAYSALVYEGGSGTTAATDASRITHRGPIIAV